MKIVEPGHVYLLDNLGDPGAQTLTFIRRNSDAVTHPFEHPGTNTQEVMRALIDRTNFLDGVLPSVETRDAAYYLRMALFCYEARAWRRKQADQNKTDSINEYVERYGDTPFNEQDIELLPVGSDGHILLKDTP